MLGGNVFIFEFVGFLESLVKNLLHLGREMGLGSAAKGGVTLAGARKAAKAARDHLAAGIDPLMAEATARRQRTPKSLLQSVVDV